MPITFDRSVCRDLNETISREWLITNGLGGYASGTIAGTLTRMEQGLLVASPLEGASPQLLLAKIDEEVVFDQRTYYLGTNEYADGTLNPSGFAHLETFRLEEGLPIFTYHLGGIDGILLEKRIWMPHGQNTTYIQYRLIRMATQGRTQAPMIPHGYSKEVSEAAQRVITLTLLPFSAYRPIHEPQYGNNDWHFHVQTYAGGGNSSGRDEWGSYDEQEEVVLPKGAAGCTIRAWEGAHPYAIFAVGHQESSVTFLPTNVWYWHFLRRHEKTAGRPPTDDLYLPGVFRAKLWPGEDVALTMIVTAEGLSSQAFGPGQIHLSYRRAVDYQHGLFQPHRYFGEGGATGQFLPVLPLSTVRHRDVPIGDTVNQVENEEYLHLLLQAADRFLAYRAVPRSEQLGHSPLFFSENEHAPVLVSGYYGVKESTRDTLIALPGLLLAPRRYDEARLILRMYARYFKGGLLPDRLPALHAPLQEQDYESVDTTLWYFYALDHYLRVTSDNEFLADVYPRLVDTIDHFMIRTPNGIRVDSHDGLLQASSPGKALTWMNATINGVPITPRMGKPVEVNALWYFALCLMDEWSQVLYSRGYINHTTEYYKEQSARCKASFNARFWYEVGGYLYDVIDGPEGDDASLRPNQVLALSLRHAVLDEVRHGAVLEQVTSELVTPYGLRTLAPQEVGYAGHLKETYEDQQRALHLGSAWPWLLGPYIEALLRVEASGEAAQKEFECDKSGRDKPGPYVFLEPFMKQLSEGVLGMIDGVFDGDAPYAFHKVGESMASARSLGEILRIYNLLAHMSISGMYKLAVGAD